MAMVTMERGFSMVNRRWTLVLVAIIAASCVKQETAGRTVTLDGPGPEEPVEPETAPVEAVKEAQAHPESPVKPMEIATSPELEPSETMALMKIMVQDTEGNPVPGTVATIRYEGGDVVLSGVSDETGIVRGLIPVGATYLVRFISLDSERVEVNHEIDVPREGYLDLDLKLTYLPSQSRTFILHGVLFNSGKATLKEESYTRLSDLLEYMTAKESVVIELAGHTDSMGSGAANQRLSEARAVEVKRYLVSRGIEARRINAVGYGETQPIADNDTAEGRRENRRTVVTVLQE